MFRKKKRPSSGGPSTEDSVDISVLDLELDFLLYVKNILSDEGLLKEAFFSRDSLKVNRGGEFEAARLDEAEHYSEDIKKYEEEKQIKVDHGRLEFKIAGRSYDALKELDILNRMILDAAIMRALVKLTAIYQDNIDALIPKMLGAESGKYEDQMIEFQNYLRSENGVLIIQFLKKINNEVEQKGKERFQENFVDNLNDFVERQIEDLGPKLQEKYSQPIDLEERAEHIENKYWELAGLKRDAGSEPNDDEIEVEPTSQQPNGQTKPANTVDWKTIGLIAGGVVLGLAVTGAAIAAVVLTHGAALPVLAVAFGVAAKVALGTSIGASVASALGITVVATGAGTTAAAVGGTAGYATSKIMNFFSRNRQDQDSPAPSPTMERNASDLEHEVSQPTTSSSKRRKWDFWNRKKSEEGADHTSAPQQTRRL